MTASSDESFASNELPRIDVVVRTLALAARQQALKRALDSIQMLSAVDARPIVVVNGDRWHPPVLDMLQRRPGILLHHLPEASAARAITAGRRLVKAPYFMFLDDDDELLAPGLQRLAAHVTNDSDWDVVITNGYFSSGGQRRPMYLDLHAHADNPLRSLVGETWLCPGASLFRTESVSADALDVNRDHQEWTNIAFLLALTDLRIRFLDVPTVVYYDTEGSASKGLGHQEAALQLLEEMKADSRVDAETLAAMERKYRNTLHILANQYWRQGAHRKAWRYHLRSMRPPFTFKYLLFSRKLLLPRRMP